MTIYGWDMSHYDLPGIGSAVSQGVRFVTHKAGGDATDAELDDWWADVKDDALAGRIEVGAYWVLRPDLHPSAAGSADSFLDRLDAVCPGWRDMPFILQADCEEWNGDGATKPSRAYIRAFCDRLVSKMPKLKPMVYASAGQYGSSLSGLGYPLWNARYPYSTSGSVSAEYSKAGGDNGKGWAAYSGQVPAIWQYSSTATIGGQTTSDANAFRGTLDDLISLTAPGWGEEDSVTTQSDMLAALNTYFGSASAAPFVSTQPDGKTENLLGQRVLGQPIPNPFLAVNADGTAQRSATWVVLVAIATALTTDEPIDPAALAAALAPIVVAGVVAGLGDKVDAITQDEVTAAVTEAFHEAFGQTPNA